MNDRRLLGPLGLALIIAGFIQRGSSWMVVWPGANLLALAIAHATGAHGVFGKRSDGRIPIYSRLFFLLLLAWITAAWHIMRLCSHDPATSIVTDRLIVARRLLASEIAQCFDVENYVDLTAEFCEPMAIARLPAYRCFPILNASAPDADVLRDAVRSLRPGRTFVHCGHGHGRTTVFALAVLITSGVAHGIEDALGMLKAARPAMRLNRTQRRCIQLYFDRAAHETDTA